MPRKPKQHVRNPLNGRVALCKRQSVQFAEKPELATCKECIMHASSGALDRLEFEKEATKTGGYNQTGKPQLTDLQKAFAAHPLVTTNPRKAAVEVGYSETFAKSHAHKLRKQLYPLIMKYQREAQKHVAISKARVQMELAALGFANVMDYFEVREDGSMIPKKMGDLTREQAAAIQEFEVSEFEDPRTGKIEQRISRLKLADKRANLVELGKTIGMFQPKATADPDEHEKQEQIKRLSDEDLKRVEQILEKGMKAAEDERKDRAAIEHNPET